MFLECLPLIVVVLFSFPFLFWVNLDIEIVGCIVSFELEIIILVCFDPNLVLELWLALSLEIVLLERPVVPIFLKLLVSFSCSPYSSSAA